MAITVLLSGLPARTMAQTAFDAAYAQLMTDLPTWGGQANALAASMTATAAGTALAMPYTFSTTITDSDPGAGTLRLSSATQNTSTVIRMDLLGANAADYTTIIDLFDDSTSSVKGLLSIISVADPTKFLIFSVSSLASPSGYKNVTGSCAAYSAASPFSNGDSLLVVFSRTGDAGNSGIGNRVLLSTINAAGASTVDFETTIDSTYDTYIMTGDSVVVSADGTTINARYKQAGAYVTTSTYDWRYDKSTIATTANTVANAIAAAQSTINIVDVIGNASHESCRIELELYAPSSTTLQKVIKFTGVKVSNAETAGVIEGIGTNSGVGAVTGIRLYPNSGTITGTFKLYGIAK